MIKVFENTINLNEKLNTLLSLVIFDNNIDINKIFNNIDFDINTYYYWLNSNYKTTLLLSAVQIHNKDLIIKLLNFGADVNLRCENNFGIIDYLIMGHKNYTKCLEIYNIIIKYNPPLLINIITKNDFENSNHSLKDYHELENIIKICDIINDNNMNIESNSVIKLIIDELLYNESYENKINELTKKLKKDTVEHYLFWNYVKRTVMNRLEDKIDIIVSKYE
jgi:hypothetical protein